MIKRAEEQDRERITRTLYQDEGINTPILSYMDRYGFGKRFQDIWVCQTEENRETAVLLRHFNHLYLYDPDDCADYEEMASFCSFVDTDIVWGGLKHLQRLLPGLPGYELVASKHMILTNPQSLFPGEGVEPARADQSAQLAAMIFNDADFREFYHSEQEIRTGIRRRIEMGQCHYMIAQVDGVIASAAYASLESRHYLTIGGVVTRPEYRGRGLASQVVSALCRSLLRRGKTPNLFYRNEAAGRLYRKLGFMEAGDYGMLRKA